MSLASKLSQFRAESEEGNQMEKMDLIRQMSLAELSKETIQFGKAKVGQPFPQAYQDTKWTEWFVGQYEKSTKEAHAKYITYVEKKLDQEIEMSKGKGKGKKPVIKMSEKKMTSEEIRGAQKVTESEASSWEAIKDELSDQESFHLEPHGMPELTDHVDQLQEGHRELNNRVTQMENVLQEVLHHVKNLSMQPPQWRLTHK